MKLNVLLENINEKKVDYTFQSLKGKKDGENLEKIAETILEGGQLNIDKDTLVNNLRKASVISLVKKDDDIVGIGALKVPNESYKQSVFAKIGKHSLASHHKYEMGYFYVKPAYRKDVAVIRGIMSELHKNSKQEDANIYMTLRRGGHTDKPKLLGYLGFTLLGEYDNIRVYGLGHHDWKSIDKKIELHG